MRLLLGLLALTLVLAGCSTKPIVYDDEAVVRSVAYRQPGPSYFTLYTIIRNQTGGGGHSALLINASQRVIFDPAGSFYMEGVPEQHDVLFGITPNVEFYYRSAHARSTYHVRSQTVEVTPQQAELALQLVRQAGPVTDAFCASSIAGVLRQIPGFESIGSTMYPITLSERFAKIPGVEQSEYYEDDNPDLEQALAENKQKLLTD